jgi:cytochrome o ubiquinol oxidase subunit 3
MNYGTLKVSASDLGSTEGQEDESTGATVFGFWLFLMSDAILFGLVFATYLTSVAATAGGPGPHELYDITSVFIETQLLLASSFTMCMASLALKYQRGRARVSGWLTVTLALGLAFLGLELHDFASMFAKGGTPSRSGFLSAFFDLVPLHGLHVAGGSIWLLCLLGQAMKYGLDSQLKLGLMRLSLFWHFLDIVWIAIFSAVYLAGIGR